MPLEWPLNLLMLILKKINYLSDYFHHKIKTQKAVNKEIMVKLPPYKTCKELFPVNNTDGLKRVLLFISSKIDGVMIKKKHDSFTISPNFTNSIIMPTLNKMPYIITARVYEIINQAMLEYYVLDEMEEEIIGLPATDKLIDEIRVRLLDHEANMIISNDLSFREYLLHKFGIKDANAKE